MSLADNDTRVDLYRLFLFPGLNPNDSSDLVAPYFAIKASCASKTPVRQIKVQIRKVGESQRVYRCLHYFLQSQS
jgi:hypothetical protein